MSGYFDADNRAILEDWWDDNTVAFLVLDSTNLVNRSATLSTIAALELPSGGGYERKNVVFTSAVTFVGADARRTADPLLWVGSGGGIPNFNKVIIVANGGLTIGGTTGRLIRWFDLGQTIARGPGQEFEYTPRFDHRGTISAV